MDKGDSIIRIVLIFGCIGIVVTIIWAAVTYEPSPVIVYLLPDGVICERNFLTGHLGKATHEFSNCSDGYTHINPEKYRRVRK